MDEDIRAATADDGIPLGELTDAPSAPRSGPGGRSRRLVALTVALAVVAGGTVVAARVSSSNPGARKRVGPPAKGRVATIDDGQARLDVLSALRETTASGSFALHFHLSESSAPGPSTTLPGSVCANVIYRSPTATGPIAPVAPTAPVGPGPTSCGYLAAPSDVTISGDGAVVVDPTAMVTTSNVPGLGEINTRVNGTDVWESGGGNYGMTGGTGTGAGAPLSGFADLVLGTLGQREGAIAISNLASPTGYLDLAEQAITGASQLADTMLDGIRVHVYEVTLDTTSAVDRPGLTDEEITTRTAAQRVLEQQGYRSTTVRLSIDLLGFIRRAQTVVRFADGGTVDGDTTFADFGCSAVVMTSSGPSIDPRPSGCAGDAPSTPATPTTPAP